MSNYIDLIFIFFYFLVAKTMHVSDDFTCYVQMMDNIYPKIRQQTFSKKLVENTPPLTRSSCLNFIIFTYTKLIM